MLIGVNPLASTGTTAGAGAAKGACFGLENPDIVASAVAAAFADMFATTWDHFGPGSFVD